MRLRRGGSARLQSANFATVRFAGLTIGANVYPTVDKADAFATAWPNRVTGLRWNHGDDYDVAIVVHADALSPPERRCPNSVFLPASRPMSSSLSTKMIGRQRVYQDWRSLALT